jgi:hypothetical protein
LPELNKNRLFGQLESSFQDLREVTGLEDATVISRSHLPRMLAKLDWQDLNEVINGMQ